MMRYAETNKKSLIVMPLNELLERIEKFHTSSLNEKYAFISELIDIYPILNYPFPEEKTFRRIRKIKVDEYPSNVQDLLWRGGGIASIGRANPEGFPVLYVADKMDTALKETRVEDDCVLLSELKIRKGSICRLATIGEFMHTQRTGLGYLLGQSAGFIKEILDKSSYDGARSLLIMDAFLYECLLKDDEKYLISSFVAKCIFEKNENVSAVAYPSVRQHGAVNFAIRTDHFWKSWSIVGARRMLARHLAYGYYETTKTEHVIGITRNGHLVWEKGVIADNTLALLEPPWHPAMEECKPYENL